MLRQMMPRDASRSGFTLAEILVVTLLLVMLSGGLAYFYLGSGGKDPKTGQQKKTPLSVAKDTVCKSNIGQVRQSVEASKAGSAEETLPQSLTELNLPSELLSCAVGKEPYQYDATSGTVRCVHPGHENF